MQNMTFKGIPLLALLSAFPVLCSAAEPAAPPNGGLGWWQRSSLSYDTSPKQYLYHVEGTLSFMDARGNTEGSSLDMKGGFDVRKGRVTNRFSAGYSKRDMVYGFGGGAVDVTESTIRNHVDYDLTKHLVLTGGLEHYFNTMMFIDGRTTAYGALGMTLAQSERHKLNVTGGLGFSSYQFDGQGVAQVNPMALARVPDLSPSSVGSLVMQSWQWHASPMLTLKQDSQFLDYFDGLLGHRWVLGLDLNVPISKKFSIAPAYRITNENNEIVKALGIKPRDRTMSIGLRVSI